jgi:hypothetical protein
VGFLLGVGGQDYIKPCISCSRQTHLALRDCPLIGGDWKLILITKVD